MGRITSLRTPSLAHRGFNDFGERKPVPSSLEFGDLDNSLAKPYPESDITQLMLNRGADISNTTGELDGNNFDFKNIDASSINNGETLGKVYYSAVVKAGDDAYYTDIQSAIDDGNTSIFVREGTYTLSNNIISTAGLKLIGENKENVIIDFNSTSNQILLNNTGVVFENFTLKNSGLGSGSGIIYISSNSCKVKNVDIISGSGGYGIEIDNAEYCLIEDSYIDSTLEDGVYILGYNDGGTILGNNKISNCLLKSNSGVRFYYTQRNSVVGCKFESCSNYGIESSYSRRLIIDRCIIDSIDGDIGGSNGRGISIINTGQKHKITNCYITNCFGAAIRFDFGTDINNNIILGNILEKNCTSEGIEEISCGDCNETIISNNLVDTNTSTGISIGSDGVLTGNIVIGATDTGYSYFSSTNVDNNQDL